MKTRTIGEHTVSFERRRYDKTFYTWVYLHVGNGKTVCLGDPWPCTNPKTSEISTAIEYTLNGISSLDRPAVLDNLVDMEATRAASNFPEE